MTHCHQGTPAPKPVAIERLPAPRLFVVGARSPSRAARCTSRRPPPFLPLMRGINRKPLATRAQRPRPTFKCTDAQRGRPRGRDGQPCRFHALHTALAARQASKSVAPRSVGPDGGQPRCARGNPKESPKARTRMTTGQSGANAPDRNRGRPPSGPPDRGATYEDSTTPRKKGQNQTFKPEAATTITSIARRIRHSDNGS